MHYLPGTPWVPLVCALTCLACYLMLMKVVNAMIDLFQSEAGRLASDYGLTPLLAGDELPPGVPVRLSERMDVVRILLQRMTEELLVADAERR